MGLRSISMRRGFESYQHHKDILEGVSVMIPSLLPQHWRVLHPMAERFHTKRRLSYEFAGWTIIEPRQKRVKKRSDLRPSGLGPLSLLRRALYLPSYTCSPIPPTQRLLRNWPLNA